VTLDYVLPPLIAKELRALLPTIAAVVLTLVAVSVLGGRWLFFGSLAYGLGAVALGAQVIGHEYSHRTLGQLLALPVNRRRLLTTKLGVLMPVLAILTAAGAAVLLPVEPLMRPSIWIGWPFLLIAVLCGAVIAPVFTMLCRSTLAGFVFTIAIPGMIELAGEIGGTAIYGVLHTNEIAAFKRTVFMWGMGAVVTFAALAIPRLFMRLEAIDGAGGEFALPSLARDASASPAMAFRRRSPLWLLIKKELRLQQMSFIVAAFFALALAALMLVDRAIASGPGPGPGIPIELLTMLYTGLLAVLIGALPSAEEHQLGTRDWQACLPVSGAWQWAIKAITTFVLTVLLCLGAPALLFFATGVPFGNNRFLPEWSFVGLAVIVLMASAVALYVSTVSTSGVKALVLTFPVILGLVAFVRTAGPLAVVFGRSVMDLFDPQRHVLISLFEPRPDGVWTSKSYDALQIGVTVVGMALVAWLAGQNHRSNDRLGRRIGWATAVVMLYALMAIAAFGALFTRFPRITRHSKTTSLLTAPVASAASPADPLHRFAAAASPRAPSTRSGGWPQVPIHRLH
jgi:hypothetical protein